MLVRRTLVVAAVTAAILVTLQVPFAGQLPSPLFCPRNPGESDLLWIQRCDAEKRREEERAAQQSKEEQERRVREVGQATAETARQRAILEKQPPLPAARNRLLGRWETSTRPPAGGDPFAQLAGMFTGCGVLLGDGILEFTADRWAVYDSDGRNDMGAISYRGGANGAVFGLPATGSVVALLPFEFDNPDQIHLVGVVCTLKRTTATAPAGRATATPPQRSPTTGAAASGPRGAAPAPAVTRSPLNRFNGKRGYDCPAGQLDVSADTCTGETDKDTCVIVRVNEPIKNAQPATFTETIAAFKKRVAGCTQKPLVYLDGDRIEFAP